MVPMTLLAFSSDRNSGASSPQIRGNHSLGLIRSGPMATAVRKPSRSESAMLLSGASSDRKKLSSSALVGFRGGGAVSRNQACDKGAEQGSPTPARVVHDLEEPEIERQLVLRDAPVRAEPGAQQGPEPLDGVDVHLAEPVTIFVAGILTPGMADCLMLIAPGGQAGIDAILVRMDEGAQGNGGGDDRPDRALPHVGQPAQDHLPTPLDQAEDWGLVLFQRAPTRCALQLAAPPRAPLLATAVGWPLWPATT